MTTLEEKEIGFKSLSEQIDTTTSGGKLVFHIFGALAEFERELIRERTRAGLAAARARGRQGGRPKKLDTPKKIAMAQALYDARDALDQRHLPDAGGVAGDLVSIHQTSGIEIIGWLVIKVLDFSSCRSTKTVDCMTVLAYSHGQWYRAD